MTSIEHITGVFLKYGYTTGQIAVLDCARRESGLSVNAVAARIGMRQSSVTACLNRLYADNLIATSGVPTMRVGHSLVVSIKGVKLLNAIQRDLDDDL